MLLLEVLIAFSLVVLCALPLVAPHIELLRGQRQIIRWIELDHTVNLLYADILEKLYYNTLPWEEILAKHPYAISQETLKQLGYKNLPPTEAVYFFEDVENKSNNEGVSLHQIKLILRFRFSDKTTSSDYTYLLPIAHFGPSSGTAETPSSPSGEEATVTTPLKPNRAS
jgi:hypothetical protein